MIQQFEWRRAHVYLLAPLALFMAAACSSSISDDSGDVEDVVILSTTGAVDIHGPQGGPFPSGTRTLQLHNNSGETAIWRMSSSHAWLNATPSAGLIGPDQEMPVVVEIDQTLAASLAVGTYPTELRLRTRNNPSGDTYLAFNLHVTPGNIAIFRAEPSGGLAIRTSTAAADNEIDGEIAIENTGQAPMTWTAESQDGWLRLGTDGDMHLLPGETDTLNVYIKESELSILGLGAHQSQVTIRNTANTSQLVTIPVSVVLAPTPGNRVTEGLIAEYLFEEGSGSIVHDSSGIAPPQNLHIQDPSAVQWQASGLSILSPTLLSTPGPATRITETIRQTSELTVEAWIRPANVIQHGPARLIGISNGPYLRNFTLAQGLWGGRPRDTFNMRLRSTGTNLDGMPLITTNSGTASIGMQHLVYVRNTDGRGSIYLNGYLIQEMQIPGNTTNWDSSFRLAVANEIGASRPWLGEMFMLAVYDHALTPNEILLNMAAGNGTSNVGHLNVLPAAELHVSAIRGNGPTGSLGDYQLTNIGGEELEWGGTSNASWLTLGSSSGFLQSTQTTTLSTQLDPAAIAALPAGTYRATVRLVNQTSLYGSTLREVVLTVNEPGAPSTGNRPGAHNTGPSNPGALQPVGGMTITQDGAVIENVHIFGAVNIEANNVTLRNFIIDAGGQPYGIRANSGKHGIVIEDGELINVASAHIYGGGFEARRLNLHESGGDGFKTTNDVLVEACWVHHIGTAPGAHADCNQTRSGSNFVFRGNFFDIPIDIGAPYKQNACWIMQTGDGPIDNVLVEDNWINGGNFSVYFENKLPSPGSTRPNYGDPTNCRMINNRFGRDNRYGVLRLTGYVYMAGNRWDDNGQLMSINNN